MRESCKYWVHATREEGVPKTRGVARITTGLPLGLNCSFGLQPDFSDYWQNVKRMEQRLFYSNVGGCKSMLSLTMKRIIAEGGDIAS